MTNKNLILRLSGVLESLGLGVLERWSIGVLKNKTSILSSLLQYSSTPTGRAEVTPQCDEGGYSGINRN
jgi:hypothetical protein